MRKTGALLGLATAWMLAGSGDARAQLPSVAQLLEIKPRFGDVAISNPTGEELKDCQVRNVLNSDKKNIGVELIDGRKQVVRRYFASKDSAKMNVWSFYKDGVEVFRQIDSDLDGKVDQYRWLGSAGMKWGVSRNQDGKIDAWQIIAAEEVAQEAFTALATGDFARLKALYISPDEIKALGLPQAAAAKMLQAQQAAAAKFQQALGKQPNLAKATFVRVDSGAPGCWLADGLGTPKDVIKFTSLSIMFETAAKQHDWFQTGEIVQVGQAWRLVDIAPEIETNVSPSNPQFEKLLAALGDIEQQIAKIPNDNMKPNKELAGHYYDRAALCEKIIAVAEAKEKETWYKQILDSLQSAALAGHEKALSRLQNYRELLVKAMPHSNLAGYAAYRELWAQFGPKIMANPDLKVQEAYHEQLAKFVQEYPNADDTADALHTLGMGCEFAGTKEKEEEAAKYYRLIYTNFKDHSLADWAQGAERRLKLAGNPLVLSGTLSTGNACDISQLKNKVTIVYYWASHSVTSAGDFARLKQMVSGQKDVELVCVNLDQKESDAAAFLQTNPLPAYHIIQAAKDTNGLRGALANYYGINVLPTVFLVGRDGRVINAKLQIADLDEALKKAVQP
jgi:Thioredoxin-like